MKRHVLIGGRPGIIEWQQDGDAVRFRWQDGTFETGTLVQVEPGAYSLLVGGRSYQMRVTPIDGRVDVSINGITVPVDVVDPRQFRPGGRGAGLDGPQSVAAPMPGKLIRVLVAEGDRVEHGQGIAVVEAMKMQNEMKSPKTGRVIRIAARAGDVMNAGDVLAVIE